MTQRIHLHLMLHLDVVSQNCFTGVLYKERNGYKLVGTIRMTSLHTFPAVLALELLFVSPHMLSVHSLVKSFPADIANVGRGLL